MLAVASAGVLKDPERAAAVSLAGGGVGLLLMVVHYVQIRAVSASADGDDDGARSAVSRLCCRVAEVWTDMLATYRLWWRAGALYVAVVFAWEAMEWVKGGSMVMIDHHPEL